MLPKRVAFRGYNHQFLKGIWLEGYQYLQFSSSDGNDGRSAHEVSLQHDGHIRIKSEYYDKFWRRSPDWIYGDADWKDEENPNTLFWPVKIDSRTIALRNAANNNFCGSLTTEGKTDSLNAAYSSISDLTKLVVEELVLESEVYDVRYRMEDSRVFDEQPYLAGVGTAINESDTESTFTVKVVREVTETSSFTHNYSLKIGVETTFRAGVPFIVDGEIKASAEVTGTIEWGSNIAKKRSVEGSLEIKVPSKRMAKVRFVGTEGKCSVPFSYTQRNKSSTDGHYVTTHHNYGVFYGTNYFGFTFEQPAFDPL